MSLCCIHRQAIYGFCLHTTVFTECRISVSSYNSMRKNIHYKHKFIASNGPNTLRISRPWVNGFLQAIGLYPHKIFHNRCSPCSLLHNFWPECCLPNNHAVHSACSLLIWSYCLPIEWAAYLADSLLTWWIVESVGGLNAVLGRAINKLVP